MIRNGRTRTKELSKSTTTKHGTLEMERGGIGVVTHANNDTLIDYRSWAGKNTSATNTKAKTILQGVNLARQRQWREIIIESDFEYLIQQITGPVTN